MSAFLEAVLSFPTVIFTVLLVFFLLYGFASLVGAADIEWLDGLLGVDEVENNALEGVLSSLGIAGIPLSIFGGIAAIFAWLSSFIAMRFLGEQPILIDAGIAFGAGILGIAIGSRAVFPLRKLFTTPPAPVRKALVGKICTIRSLRVDDASGTAEVDDGGAGFIAEVRCFRDNELTRGSRAIVYDYDSEQGIYHVGPIDSSIAN